MTPYLLVIALSGLASMLLVPLARRLASALGALDYPEGRRRIHAGAIPDLAASQSSSLL